MEREHPSIRTLTYTVQEFCKAAHLSRPTVYELIHADGFPALQVGRKWLIPVKAAEAWLESHIGEQLIDN